MKPSTHPIFWRDDRLPFVELRQVLDGRLVSYAPHTHETWSIGAILAGQSEFLCMNRLHVVQKGHLVMMNPEEVHACNPLQDSAWAYYMMHLDKDWLATMLFDHQLRDQTEWQNTLLDTLLDEHLYESFVFLCDQLMANDLSHRDKAQSLRIWLRSLFSRLNQSMDHKSSSLPYNPLYQVANYLNEHCLDDTPIAEISRQFGYSTSYLVRTFKRHFYLTPHAYRLNRRIQLGQKALKTGQSIADIAHSVGFNDQAHFQRVFKQRVAATPDQYRRT
ncbi:AraC family transcriptional regulator [Marinomonas posidonica]|uniref:Transcriptional regulator, AraC family n=1 Tax=Marinomonas posidonica (strain CECT 7376 / NCIMB 14433 / IVIA-Po-181) TaxID=491952 RepID=F6D1E5_MARPP|nr:AraC family transcriptional regulator [Marinomonas posidonica]AEF56034.1 transcriptional regulator, AraC family [Marinomonas posidonica IVIA-Po-181]